MIAVFTPPDQIAFRDLFEQDAVVQRYRAFFDLLDWAQVPERDTDRPWPGPIPHPRSAYLKAFLVKICEGKACVTHLRAFLVDHPLLVLLLGFHPVPALDALYGFAVEKTVPGVEWLRDRLRSLDETFLHLVLNQTVHALQAEIPDLGRTVAFDVKHIYAWVQQNNPKAYVEQRFDPDKQPPGDRDCRLGVKRRSNQENPDGTKTGPAECLWGYGTGVASATSSRSGDVVLAEFTQTFNENDITYFRPLRERTITALGKRPRNITADAAFDAWYVYEAAHEGITAIPLNLRGQASPNRDANGTPRCTKGLSMIPGKVFRHEDGYQAQRFLCPLLHPTRSGQTCAVAQFAKGGCTRIVNTELGGYLRITLDRTSPAFQEVYDQRTCVERINSQATALGIERPKVRNARSVAHLNTLTYIVINLRALQRVRTIKSQEVPAA